ETSIRKVLGSSALIVRTSWLYAKQGNNFVNTMLGLMQTKPALNVVTDQIATPTWAASLARFLWLAAEQPAISGIHHYSDAGVASWYDFAIAIQEEALAGGLLDKPIPMAPVASEDYSQAAKRPAFSVLDKRPTIRSFGIELTYWRAALRQMLGDGY
ncbi:SDR family oxidoreductase, partial [Dyella sp.]|uniref:SDR family oxidoreductase n=1 Tax=Dyella sp. TaxID=1869338 RepID=UPI002D784E0C